MKRMYKILGVTAVVAAAVYGFMWWFASGYILNYIAHGGGWPEMSTSDIRMSREMRYAVHDPKKILAGDWSWQTTAPGFEIAEVPVYIKQGPVDSIYLARIDPKQFTFTVHTHSEKYRHIKDWEKQLPKSALIVNGSFFAKGNAPATPLISLGKLIGPTSYDAQAGVFVANSDGARVIDLTHGGGWEAAVAGAENAMVAYPLLIGEDGEKHVKVKSNWLANRTFIAEDKDGRIIIGSTRTAFFSLDRLANFLRREMPELKTVLNLDGGPVACQSVRSGGVYRLHVARWEAQVEGDRAKVLHWPVGYADMPIVLAVTPR